LTVVPVGTVSIHDALLPHGAEGRRGIAGRGADEDVALHGLVRGDVDEVVVELHVVEHVDGEGDHAHAVLHCAVQSFSCTCRHIERFELSS
jgi:hypothetical protein